MHIRGRCKDHKPQLLIYGGPVQGCVKCGLGSELMIMPRWVCAAWRINVIYWSSSCVRIGYWWVIMLMYIVNAVVHCSMLVILAVGCDVFLALTIEFSRVNTMASSGWSLVEMFLGNSLDKSKNSPA